MHRHTAQRGLLGPKADVSRGETGGPGPQPAPQGRRLTLGCGCSTGWRQGARRCAAGERAQQNVRPPAEAARTPGAERQSSRAGGRRAVSVRADPCRRCSDSVTVCLEYTRLRKFTHTGNSYTRTRQYIFRIQGMTPNRALQRDPVGEQRGWDAGPGGGFHRSLWKPEIACPDDRGRRRRL